MADIRPKDGTLTADRKSALTPIALSLRGGDCRLEMAVVLPGHGAGRGPGVLSSCLLCAQEQGPRLPYPLPPFSAHSHQISGHSCGFLPCAEEPATVQGRLRGSDSVPCLPRCPAPVTIPPSSARLPACSSPASFPSDRKEASALRDCAGQTARAVALCPAIRPALPPLHPIWPLGRVTHRCTRPPPAHPSMHGVVAMLIGRGHHLGLLPGDQLASLCASVSPAPFSVCQGPAARRPLRG